MNSRSYKRALRPLIVILALAFCTGAWCENAELEALQQEVKELRARDAEKTKQIEALQKTVQSLLARQPPPTSALDAAVQSVQEKTPTTPEAARAAPSGAARQRLVDVSFDVLTGAAASSAPDDILGLLQGGDHDPNHRGFTLQQAEMSFAGAVDPFFTGQAHIVAKEDGLELEEAYATTTSLPWDLQVKAGYFLTEFGRINPTHPHAWNWIDQPIVVTRLMGPDGARGAGVRASWLLPVDWYSNLVFSAQKADDDSMVSFLGEGHEPYVPGMSPGYEALGLDEVTVGDRPRTGRKVNGLDDLVYLVRWENSLDLSPETSAELGFSAMHGPNDSGPHGDTWIYGSDLVVKWRPANSFNGWPFLIWESEIMDRQYHADSWHTGYDDGGGALALRYGDRTLKDWGMYTQLLWGFHKDWAAGLRYEYASGSGGDLLSDRADDPLRDNRWRISPILTYQPTHFSHLRLQYNYDHPDFLHGDAEHTLLLSLEVLWGAHPAHNY